MGFFVEDPSHGYNLKNHNEWFPILFEFVQAPAIFD
jgi:hypothetical protein